MVNRGWLRIVEASFAILIIFGALLVISQRTKVTTPESDLSSLIIPLLDEIAKNNSLRESIILGNENSKNEIESFLSEKIKQLNIGYAAKVCEINEVCGLEVYPTTIVGDLYTKERIISSTLTEFSPKKIKIFLWRIR